MENNITAFDQAFLFNAYPAEILDVLRNYERKSLYDGQS